MVFATHIHALIGVGLVIAFAVGLFLLWHSRTRNPDPAFSFQLGFLTTASIFQFLLFILLLLRQVPKDAPPVKSRVTTNGATT